ncbi:TetR/AcrR family transcriptional regulator [Vibrio hannami]|uniref:TetR/AcrR family transcriptional regulator n=1 Tax=Vibrio hannami TaxID=2717094 RepID=UPI00240F196A|nr:TetR/AcrR family transcriptional regulator [Vibrio hannami]MDG3084887.1 TetR/AcrR family transcriptional regulator [Vibrio hannami]
MANHAKFDRDDVVEKAKNLYWEKGFHATSMRNLQDVIDMRPGSIYSTFGSKENLFKEALLRYSSDFDQRIELCCNEEQSPLEALKLFVKASVIDSRHSAPSGMCMLVKTVAELTDENKELLSEAQRLLKNVETQFSRVIRMSIERGELDSASDPIKLARYLQVQVIGLRTYVRANNNEQDALDLLNDIFETGPLKRVK